VKNNIPLRLSFLYIGFCFFAALFTYFLIPDKTTHANSMNLRIQSEKPGFKTKIIKVPLKDYEMNFFDFIFHDFLNNNLLFDCKDLGELYFLHYRPFECIFYEIIFLMHRTIQQLAYFLK